jgi:hypothetical protein
MLAGFTPFDRGSPVATAIAHRDEDAIDVREVRADVPARVAAVIATALRKQPADRYQSASEMERALAPAMADDYAGDTAVLPPPTVGSAPTSVTRAGWWIAAAALAVGGTVAAIVVTNSGDDPEALPTVTESTANPMSTAFTSTTTTLPSTTLPASTTVPPTSAAAIASPAATVDELIAVMSIDPSRYGPRTAEVVDRLDDIDNRGRKSRDRAAGLLDDAEAWVESGELTPEAYNMLDPVLSSLVNQGGGNDQGDEDEDD